MKSLSIGNLKLKNSLLLAPMVDVTNLAFRILCRRAGCSMAYTQMLQVEGLYRGEKSIKLNTLTNSKDKPLGIQITGKRVSDFKKVIPLLRKYELVDLNCGCPGHLTLDNSSGAYLLRNPDKIALIIKLLKDNGLNVSAKIRLGFKHNNVLEISKKIEKAGADAITLHPRLANQSYGVKADWTWFSKVKKKIGIPLIGNGDVDSPKKAKEILEICDGLMIARAAIGNPLIFKEILYYLKTGKEKKFDYRKNLNLYLEYLDLSKKYGLLKMNSVKYIGGKFLRGFKGAPETRDNFMKLKSFSEIEKFIKKLL